MKNLILFLLFFFYTFYTLAQSFDNNIQIQKDILKVSGLSYKHIKHYNSQINKRKAASNRLDSTLHYAYDDWGNWLKYIREEFHYDVDSNLQEEIQTKYLGLFFLSANRHNYSYDSSNRETNDVFSFWDDTKKIWKNLNRISQDYFQDSTREIYSIVDTSTNTYVDVYKYMYYNDSIGDTLTEDYQWLSYNNKWKLLNKVHYFYDSLNRINYYEVEYVNQNTQQLYVAYNGTILYNQFNKIDKFFGYIYNQQQDTFILNSRYFYTYSSNGDLTRLIKQSSSGQIFKTFEEERYTYSTNGNLFSYVFFDTWSSGSQRFREMQEMYYNNSYTQTDLLLPYSSEEDLRYFNHMLNELVVYSSTTPSPSTVSDTILYYYFSKNTSIRNVEKTKFKVFPNPCNDTFIIEYDSPQKMEILVSDLNGRILKHDFIRSGDKISTLGLAKGVYILKIVEDSKQVRSSKLIVY